MALWYPGRYVREDLERVSGTRSSTSVVKLISYKEGMMMNMKRLVVCALAWKYIFTKRRKEDEISS